MMAMGMEVNIKNSSLLCNGLDEELGAYMRDLFPFNFSYFIVGLKDRGYMLKTNDYVKQDWMWPISKVEKRINFWCNNWLY